MQSKFWTFTVLAMLSVGLGACAIIKPARVLSPVAFGLTCPRATICIEDPKRLPQAEQLYAEGVGFVQNRLGPFNKQPRLLFCSTKTCFKRFGNPAIKAQSVGTWGAVINADGWDNYIVRHEMIHHWQNENFGHIPASVTLPRWFIEGMAYALSEDPRVPLSHIPSEAHRQQFIAWIKAGHDWRVPPEKGKPLP